MIDNITDYFDIFCAFIGALASWFFGSLDGLIKMLIALCFIDYCTGFISAYIQNRLSSAVGFTGITRKVYMFILVGMAHVIDRELLGQTALLRDAVIFFYLANEGLSVLENAVVIGIPIPEVLKTKLLQLKDNDNDNIQEKYKNKNYEHEANEPK